MPSYLGNHPFRHLGDRGQSPSRRDRYSQSIRVGVRSDLDLVLRFDLLYLNLRNDAHACVAVIVVDVVLQVEDGE